MKNEFLKPTQNEVVTMKPAHTHTQSAHYQHIRCDLFAIFKAGFIRSVFTIAFVLRVFAGWGQAGDPCDCRTVTQVGVSGVSLDISDFNGGVIPDCAHISGQLVINQSTIWDSLRISMDAGAEILVTDTLTIQNGTYISACDTLWKGIRTSTFASLHALDSYIEGAEFAMRLAGYTTFECRNNRFIDNYIGISTGSPFEADQVEVLINQVGFLTGCRFYTEEGLPIPYTGQFYAPSWPTSPSQIPYDVGYAAMYLTGTSGLNFGNRNASNAGRNMVYNMRNGIISRFSYVEVYKSTFRNLQGSIPEIYPSKFDLSISNIMIMFNV